MSELAEYDRLYAQAGACPRCHNHELIRPLVQARQFRFCWEPWRVPKGDGPFSFIFVTMERFVANCPREPEPGGVNEPLRFAIDRFLFTGREPRSYLITNMAKCSLPVDQARRTQGFRYEKCASFLETEIRKAGTTHIVSIGKQPKWYLERFRDRYGLNAGLEISWIWHYGTRNNPRFSAWAHNRHADFGGFVAQRSTQYVTFLHDEGRDAQAEAFLRHPDSDLCRVYRYSQDMTHLRVRFGLERAAR